MDYTLFDGFPELLNGNRLPPGFKLHQVDGRFLYELHLLIRCDTINLSLQLTHNAINSSKTQGSGLSLSIG